MWLLCWTTETWPFPLLQAVLLYRPELKEGTGHYFWESSEGHMFCVTVNQASQHSVKAATVNIWTNGYACVLVKRYFWTVIPEFQDFYSMNYDSSFDFVLTIEKCESHYLLVSHTNTGVGSGLASELQCTILSMRTLWISVREAARAWAWTCLGWTRMKYKINPYQHWVSSGFHHPNG